MKTKSGPDKFVNLPSLCPAFNIRAASRIITQIFDDTLKPSGLQITQFAVLVGVQIMDTPSISTLAKGLVMDRTTLTRGLKPLESEGFIKMITGDDRRTRFVKLTAKGKSVMRAHGFDDVAIHDAIQVVSYFNYINRVADAVHVELEPEMAPYPGQE